MELTGVWFPGPAVPVGRACRLQHGSGTWTMQMAFRWGGWRCEGDFCDWLSGGSPARGLAHLNGPLMDASGAGSLVGAGATDVEFSPDWKFTLEGRPAAFIDGLGERMSCS